MTVEMFLILLTFFSVVTSLATEATKKFLDATDETYQSNVLVLIVAAIVGGNGMVIFYLCNNYQWTVTNIICIFLMIFANWIGAMVGYDKVRQAITQFKGGN